MNEGFERLFERLRRLVRLWELNADDTVTDNELALVQRAYLEAARSEEALSYPWPADLVAVGEDLGLLGGEPGKGAEGPLAMLGESPSELSRDDHGALVQRAAGYEVTDYAGIFAGRGPFLTGMLTGATFLRKAPKVEFAGTIFVLSRRLCTFDPRDSVWLDRTIERLDREVPPGEHRVYVARWDDEVVAAVVLFGDKPVRSWVPARVGDVEGYPMPVPPMLPVSNVRYSIGIGDHRELLESLDLSKLPRDLEGIDALRAARGEAPLGPDELLPRTIEEGRRPMAVIALADRLESGSLYAAASDLVVMNGDGPIASNWGLDEDGAVAAYAVDFGKLRLFPPEKAGPSAVSRPAVLLERDSLARRLERGAPGAIPVEEQARRLVGMLPAWRDVDTGRLARELGRLG